MGRAVSRADYTEAMLDLVFEHGYDRVTVEEVAARAGGDRADFERHFPGKQDCAVAVLEELAENNLRAVRGAFDREPRWPDSLRAAAHAHARWILDNPKKMRFGLLETLWAGEMTSALRDSLFRAYVEMVDAGREAAPDPDAIPASTAEGVVGAITQVIVRNMGKPGGGDLLSRVPEMMYLAVRPYLGEEVARRELTLPPPRAELRGGAPGAGIRP
ncbi:MAG TPA: TetR/AcrR family transcriptional regulator [Solirubrobacterales bacterium]|nr:TetR/AcrR family transcriptional regulator [Solirubrobacterales bacterium]